MLLVYTHDLSLDLIDVQTFLCTKLVKGCDLGLEALGYIGNQNNTISIQAGI